MEQLIELLNQIQELAGIGIEALQQAAGGAEGGGPEGGAAPVAPEAGGPGAPPPEGPPEG